MEFLLVDDNEITLEIEKLMLESCGLSVTTASSGAEAVQLAKKHRFFMIFMDIHMPEMDGFTAASKIRKNDPDVLLIALSADKMPENSESFIWSGMNGSLLKPLKLDDLKELLSRYTKTTHTKYDYLDSENDIFNYDGLLTIIKSEKAVLKFLNQFLNFHSDDCERMVSFIKNREWLAAREILHNIIGISGNLFCKRLYGASRTLSGELKRETSDSLETFTSIWNETIKALSECRDSLNVDEEAADHSENWDDIRDSFNTLCEEFDVYAADIFKDNINTFRKNMTHDSFEQLKNAVFNYDFLWISENMEVLYV